MKRIFNKGYSLTEILVSLAIFSMLIVVLFSVFNQAVISWAISEGLVESQQNARIASDWISMELHEATNFFDVNSSVLTPAFSSISSVNSLIFTKPSTTTSFRTNSLQTVAYSLVNGSDLQRTVTIGTSGFTVVTNFVIASNIKSFTISHLLNDTTQPYSYPGNTYDPKFFKIIVYSQSTAGYGNTTTAGNRIVGNRVQDYVLITNVRIRNNP